MSARIRGETAPGAPPPRARTPPPDPEDPETSREAKRRGLVRVPAPNTRYAAPFHARSADVTVLDLGAVHRGAWARRYWSSTGCLYHHAYPVGYRASKVVFGRTYEMRIEEGATGPVFKASV